MRYRINEASVSTSDLMEKAKKVEGWLNEDGFQVTMSPYFAYGAYGFYFDFANGRQLFTELGTRKETMESLSKLYNQAVKSPDRYMPQGEAKAESTQSKFALRLREDSYNSNPAYYLIGITGDGRRLAGNSGTLISHYKNPSKRREQAAGMLTRTPDLAEVWGISKWTQKMSEMDNDAFVDHVRRNGQRII